MIHELPSECPLCRGELQVTRTTCRGCGVQMTGQFALAPYRNLDAEQARFMETFLRCRGVLRDVEAALGISYPTVRGRLDGLLSALGFSEGYHPVPPTPPPVSAADAKAARRREILTAVENGTLDAETALKSLQTL